MIELTQKIVRELLDYDPDTGLLTWKKRDVKWFAKESRFSSHAQANMWNGKFANKQAFTAKNGNGYFQGKIFGRLFDAHRIIWLLTKGHWPDYVDHENGNKLDNRIENLRNVTNEQNCRNTKRHKNNTSGFNGVSRYKDKWMAYIRNDGKQVFLGYFETAEEAYERRLAAEIEYKYHETHGKRE